MSAPLDIEGPAAPPRANGELVFAEPWEGRAFGLAVALHERGALHWPDFRAALIARLAAREEGTYYEHWLGAVQDVLALPPGEVTARVHVLESHDDHV